MSHRLIEVPWERLRPGVTVLQPDGRTQRAALVQRQEHAVAVLFEDGRRERHDPRALVSVVVHDAIDSRHGRAR